MEFLILFFSKPKTNGRARSAILWLRRSKRTTRKKTRCWNSWLWYVFNILVDHIIKKPFAVWILKIMSGMIKYGFYSFRTLLSWAHPPAMCCCATARPQLGRQLIPKHEMSSLKKQWPPMCSQWLVGRPWASHNSRGSSCPDIRTVSHLPAWARYGRSAVAAPSETCTKPFPTSPVFKTSCPSITGKSSTTDRRSSSCKTCCTASGTPTSWTSKWARARSWSRK